MDKEIEWEDKHDDVKRLIEERPYGSVGEALDFDLTMINEILNRENLEECDRRTIACIFMRNTEEFRLFIRGAREWEDFLIEVLGKEKVNNLNKAYFKRQIREINKKFGIPETVAGSGVIRFNPREE
jgi:hypothetical protein